MVFEDRQQAGRHLGRALKHLKGRGVVVLGLPRGGVVVAEQVAKYLDAPLGVLLVYKISHPYSPEFAIGAIAEDDNPIYSAHDSMSVDQLWLQLEEESAHEIIDQRRDMYYSRGSKPPEVTGKTVILVDDGMATGLTMIAAVNNVKDRGAKRVIVAVPVASIDSVAMVRSMTDDIVILDDTDYFMGAIGLHYRRFDQVDDLQVRLLLLDNEKVLKQKTPK